MDHALVRRLRTEVAEQIAGQRRDDAVLGLAMSPEDERQYARSLIARALASHARLELESGRVPPTAEEEEDLAAAVHAALYGVGRLQPLLDDPMVENVDINGCDRVFVGYADGRELMLDPVAETDEELVELVQTLAAYSGLSSRPFDTANPQLDLRLPDGSRLSAVMEVTKRPVVSIRRARLPKVFLSDLVGNGTLDQGLAAFLRAAVVARKNIMIAGSTNAGKTTMLRALANEIPPHERLITVERALELGLDEFPDLHPNVVAFEERLPNSEGQGRISMAELVRRSLRMNPSRVIVGEVLGDEIVTMLNAMSQGNDGSLSTIHANSSSEVFNRIATYALQAAEHLPIEASHMLIAGAINFVIFVERRNDYRSRRPASPVRVQRARGQRASTGGSRRARSGPPVRTGGRGRRHRSRRSRTWRQPATGRTTTGGGPGDLLRHAARAPRRRAGRRRRAAARRVADRLGAAGDGRPHARPTGWRPRTSAAGCCSAAAWRWSRCSPPAGWSSRSASGCSGSSRRSCSAAPRTGGPRSLRLEALASWTESLRDTIAGAVGLEQAIPASYNAAAPILKPPLAPAHRPAAHPRAAAGRAAEVRRRPRRPRRRPDPRRADPQRPAARARPARRAHRAVPGRPRGDGHAQPDRGRAAPRPGAACRSSPC